VKLKHTNLLTYPHYHVNLPLVNIPLGETSLWFVEVHRKPGIRNKHY